MWSSLTMMESMVPFFSAEPECQQGQTLSVGHSQEHVANAKLQLQMLRVCDGDVRLPAESPRQF